MLRDLLVHVDASEAGRARVKFAVHLAIRAAARLTGLHVTPPPELAPLYKPSRVASVADEVAVHLHAEALAAETIFREEAHPRLPHAAWFQAAGDMVQGISDRARYADLVILGQYEWQGSSESHPLPVAHSVVQRCGRPVLVIPALYQWTGLARAGIAWDGSREAVRAAHDALGILRLAESVELMTMSEESPEAADLDAKTLSEHLSHHDLKVVQPVRQLRSDQGDRSFLSQLVQEPYDLLVIGGYSHPMWLEFLFGGTTQSILLSSKIPIFVSQ